MARKNDKKTMIVLLIVLGLVFVTSAFWLYNILKPLDIPVELQNDIQINYVYRVKDAAIKNIQDFLDVQFSPGTVWDELYGSEQFKSLEHLEFEIDIKENIGNPTPFMASTTPEDLEEPER